jgi:mannose-1-phosphate guanylyltransferase
MKLIPTILCGGAGFGLWPVSRELYEIEGLINLTVKEHGLAQPGQMGSNANNA